MFASLDKVHIIRQLYFATPVTKKYQDIINELFLAYFFSQAASDLTKS